MTFSKQLVFWLVSTVLALGLVYGLYEDKLTSTQAQLYSTFARSTWALVLAWIRSGKIAYTVIFRCFFKFEI